MADEECEIFAVNYEGVTHLFEDPGARQLWVEERMKRGRVQEEFMLWDA